MDPLSTTLEPTTNVTHQHTARVLVWASGLTIAALTLLGFVLGTLAVTASEGALNPFTHLFFLPFVTGVYTLVGGLVAHRHPRNAIGWLILVVGLTSVLTLLANAYGQFERYFLHSGPIMLANLMTWLDSWIWWIPSLLPITIIMLLFPDGRLPSPRWRIVAWSAGIGLVACMVGTALHPGEWPEFGLNNRNPFGLEAARPVLETLLLGASVPLAIGLFGSLVSVLVRYRRATADQRIQLRWLAIAAGLAAAGMMVILVLWLLYPDNPLVLELSITFMTLSITGVIIAIGIAILRHRLWDVDRVINRTLVYGILTIIIAGMYVMVVTVFSPLVNAENNLLLSLLATGLVAVLFQPLRETVQRFINRLLFGMRDEPYVILERLSTRLEPVVALDAILPTLTETIAEGLQIPYVAIQLRQQNSYRTAAAYPSPLTNPDNGPLTTIPLVYRSETIGRLALAPRGTNEAFTPGERQLLETIARQATIAVHNVRLATDLQQAREHLVTAREEERRRLRRDLHDGLGPALAAMSFRLDAINNHLGEDHEEARALVDDLKTHVQSSLTEIRRIAYNLRPPALDELGLLAALREHFTSATQHGNLQIVFDAPSELPGLSAAAEVALYRIAIEAVTNVQHHARATSCRVSLRLEDAIQLEISDDGCGIEDQQRAGVGLMAMHERAAELGGTCQIDAAPAGGTQIIVRLPIRAAK